MKNAAHKHYKIYKPCGMLSQFVSNNSKQSRTKRFLGELFNFPEGIMPIGRLDEKSEGLLLLTTHGKVSDTINSSEIEKEYWAQLDGEIDERALIKLQNGVEIGVFGEKYQTKTCKAVLIHEPTHLPEPSKKLRIGRHRPTSWVSITLTEGKFRQVRKMTAAVGFPTLRLIRVRIGDIKIEGLKEGAVSQINELIL